jgi:hypothetical protein
MVTNMGAAGAEHPIDLEMRWNFGRLDNPPAGLGLGFQFF